MTQVKVQLSGYVPAFADSTVRLVNEVTGRSVERKPFLDGSLTVNDIEPGNYELVVTHPNLVTPVDKRRIKIFPVPGGVFVPIPINPTIFTNNPIRDIPDADLTPVQQTAQSVQERLERVGGKIAGDSIKSSDWNVLVSALSDLAGAVLELTHRVSAQGHAHPEIAEKIDEVQNNLRKFAESTGRSVLEVQRQLELAAFRRQIDEVLVAGAASEATRRDTFARVDELEKLLQADPRTFTKQLTNVASSVLTTVNTLADAQGANAADFLAREDVQKVTGVARSYREAGVVDRGESELQIYGKTLAQAGSKVSAGRV
jgi:hypothetical protein